MGIPGFVIVQQHKEFVSWEYKKRQIETLYVCLLIAHTDKSFKTIFVLVKAFRMSDNSYISINVSHLGSVTKEEAQRRFPHGKKKRRRSKVIVWTANGENTYKDVLDTVTPDG